MLVCEILLLSKSRAESAAELACDGRIIKSLLRGTYAYGAGEEADDRENKTDDGQYQTDCGNGRLLTGSCEALSGHNRKNKTCDSRN